MEQLRREQPRSEWPSKLEKVQEWRDVVKQEDFEGTPEAIEAREYMEEKWPEGSPHRDAMDIFAYMFAKDYFKEHPQYIEEWATPENRDMFLKALMVKPEFSQELTNIEKQMGKHGASVPLTNEEIKMAIDLAYEAILYDKAKMAGEHGEVAAA